MIVKQPIDLAFDLDGVLADKPPFIPKKILEFLFRGCHQNKLCYRFPTTKAEQIIRRLSHYYLFRPPIRTNVQTLQTISQNKKYRLLLISSRYSFLKPATHQWLKKRKIAKIFTQTILNAKNEQPHIFKEEQLKKIKPAYYFEDDEKIVRYLRKKINSTKIIFVAQKKLRLPHLN